MGIHFMKPSGGRPLKQPPAHRNRPSDGSIRATCPRGGAAGAAMDDPDYEIDFEARILRRDSLW